PKKPSPGVATSQARKRTDGPGSTWPVRPTLVRELPLHPLHALHTLHALHPGYPRRGGLVLDLVLLRDRRRRGHLLVRHPVHLLGPNSGPSGGRLRNSWAQFGGRGYIPSVTGNTGCSVTSVTGHVVTPITT